MAKDAKKEAPAKEVEEKKTEATKEKKWQKPEKPEAPDEEAFNASKKVYEDELEGYRSELKKLSEKIDAAQTGKESYEAEKKVLQDAFDSARGKFDELRKKQFDLIDKIKKENEQNKTNRDERRRIDKELGGMGENEEAIDAKIRALEYKMQTSSMTLKAEKDLMQEIKELKKKKPQMQALAKKKEKLDEDMNVANGAAQAAGEAAKPLDEQIKECRAEIDEAKKEKDARKAELDALREKRQNQRKAVSKEIGEKEEIKGKMTKCRDEIQKIWDSHKKKKNAHWEWERECKRIDWEIKNER